MNDTTSRLPPSPALKIEPDLSDYDGRSIILNILSFVVPPLGLILYLLLMIAKLPRKAASAGRSATIGVIAYAGAIALVALVGLILGALQQRQIAQEETVNIPMTRPPAVTVNPPAVTNSASPANSSP